MAVSIVSGIFDSQYSYKIALHPPQASWTLGFFLADFMTKISIRKSQLGGMFSSSLSLLKGRIQFLLLEEKIVRP